MAATLIAPSEEQIPRAAVVFGEIIVAEPQHGCADCVKLRCLRCDVGYWKAMHRKAKERAERLEQEIEELKAKVRLRERQLFERKSERSSGSGKRNNEPDNEPEEKRKRGQQRGAPGHGRRLQKNLPAVPEVFDFAESEKKCDCCGLPFVEMAGTEDSEEVVVEVRAHRRVIKRKRYKPTCQCPNTPGIVTAPGPAKLIPKGSLSISVWVMVLLEKFLFQCPTHRLLKRLWLTLGVHISQGTVTDGLQRLRPLFEPLYDELCARNVSESLWHADETRWLVFVELEGKQGNKWYLWVFRSQTTVAFVLDPSRSARVPLDHFGEEAEGIIVADRYSAYKVLLKYGRILIAFCWAHVRRDFLAVAKDWPAQEAWGLGWVARIAELYHLNKQRLAVLHVPKAFAEADAKLRDAVEKMVEQRTAELADLELHAASRKVLESLKRHWSGLTIFVERPWVPMDNNEGERQLRNPVVGRKNYYGSGALWSAALSAMAFSLFQTLLLWDINPQLWLEDYLQACAECGGQAPENAADYLPWNLTDEQLHKYRSTYAEEHDTS